MRKGNLAATAAAALALTGGLTSCGKDDKNDKEATSTGTTYTFATDIAPLVKGSCALSGCHGKTATGPSPAKVYEDNETNFKADKAKIIERLGDNTMPQAPGTIAAADEKKLTDFLGQ